MGSGADAIKAQLKSLSDQRAVLELEISQRSARLQAAGVGMEVPLVDGEGFPRADVDVAAIRGDRHAIITLTNDHKALTRQMEALLHQLHAQSNDAGSSARPAPAGQAAAAAPHPGQRVAAAGQPAAGPPFAVIDEVTPGSPAADAGLQVGDQLCGFAGVTKQTPGTLQAVASALQANKGRAVEAVVLRHGAPLALQLTPRQWGGRGLLGCHMRPL